ncbi:hypothetical protein BC834DRAFT_659199 [Gloeopeniophorella convolvens]|nr:hypothetical protein BC834DRAFT_659199 [Gloeopeniophorella convolvens]
MIQVCLLFRDVSPNLGVEQLYELRRICELVDNASKCAMEAGRGRNQVADEAFATAGESLGRYAMDVHPTQESVGGGIHAVIEKAAQRDKRAMKAQNRASARVGFKVRGDPSSLIRVDLQILKSPTERRDEPIRTYEFRAEYLIPNILCVLGELPGDQRVRLQQNPHLYSGSELPDKPSAYTNEFTLQPLKLLRLQEGSNILILLDRPGRIFVEYGKFSRTYGNIWKPGVSIILKGSTGELVAAQSVARQIRGDVCIWQRGGALPSRELTKWTDVLEEALLSPTTDWLIRSETSLEDAIAIELTGGWNRLRLREPKPPPPSDDCSKEVEELSTDPNPGPSPIPDADAAVPRAPSPSIRTLAPSIISDTSTEEAPPFRRRRNMLSARRADAAPHPLRSSLSVSIPAPSTDTDQLTPTSAEGSPISPTSSWFLSSDAGSPTSSEFTFSLDTPTGSPHDNFAPSTSQDSLSTYRQDQWYDARSSISVPREESSA